MQNVLLQIDLHKNYAWAVIPLEDAIAFIGRKEELQEIKSALESEKAEAVLIYGRRRVGKSEIIRESLKGYKIPVVFSNAKKHPPSRTSKA